MRSFLHIFLVAFFLSCQEQKEEVIDYTDIVETSERYQEGGGEVVKTEEFDSTVLLRNDFIENGINVQRLSIIEERLLPDRFHPNAVHKYQLVTEEDTVLFINWTFPDSVETMNAFFNWIDFFGENGVSVRVGENKRMQKQSFSIFVGDKSLIFIQQALKNVQGRVWEAYLQEKEYGKEWFYILYQNHNGKVRWYSFVEGKKEEITLE